MRSLFGFALFATAACVWAAALDAEVVPRAVSVYATGERVTLNGRSRPQLRLMDGDQVRKAAAAGYVSLNLG
jgi:hypothetical protein